jgi:hypothetical protein
MTPNSSKIFGLILALFVMCLFFIHSYLQIRHSQKLLKNRNLNTFELLKARLGFIFGLILITFSVAAILFIIYELIT